MDLLGLSPETVYSVLLLCIVYAPASENSILVQLILCGYRVFVETLLVAGELGSSIRVHLLLK